jgi:beta-lactamase family protein
MGGPPRPDRSEQVAEGRSNKAIGEQPTRRDPRAALRRTLEQAMAATPLSPGMIAAVDRPGLHWRGAVGVIDRATGAPLRVRDSYRIASVTKTFTAAAVIRLVEQGKVALDAPIARYLPAVYLTALRGDGYNRSSSRLAGSRRRRPIASCCGSIGSASGTPTSKRSSPRRPARVPARTSTSATATPSISTPPTTSTAAADTSARWPTRTASSARSSTRSC